MLSDLANGGNGDCSKAFSPVTTPVEGTTPAAIVPAKTFDEPGSFEAALAALAGLPSSLPPAAPPSVASVASTSQFIFPPDTPTSPPLMTASALFNLDATTPLAKLQEFLRNAHADLEQYAEAFVQAGCTDLETLLSLSASELRIFVEKDLVSSPLSLVRATTLTVPSQPRIFPRLTQQPFHVRLMASIMGEEKERRREVERLLALTSGANILGFDLGPPVVNPPVVKSEEPAMAGAESAPAPEPSECAPLGSNRVAS